MDKKMTELEKSELIGFTLGYGKAMDDYRENGQFTQITAMNNFVEDIYKRRGEKDG